MIDAAQTYLRRRREALEAHPTQIGLDYVAVRQDPADPARRFLDLHFVPDGAGSGKHQVLDELDASNLSIRVEDVVVDGLFELEDQRHDTAAALLVLQLRFAGDQDLARQLGTSPIFTLTLVDVPNLDPFFNQVRFSLDAAAPLDLDCRSYDACSAAPSPRSPAIDYLAKDFWSFRGLMVSRLSELLPEWDERSPADLLMTLVETLAHGADELSYFQDAVATEAYLGTARRRISVRRHARLLGYRVGEGVNARVWVSVETASDGLRFLAGSGTVASAGLVVTGTGTAFITELKTGDLLAAAGQTRRVETVLSDTVLHVAIPFDPPLAAGTPFERPGVQLLTRTSLPVTTPLAPGSPQHRQALSENPVVFETVTPLTLYVAHNRISFYNWDAAAYRLPAGCRKATLVGRLENLWPGDVLIFEEVLGPRTGQSADIDPEHRHAVRLTRVEGGEDLLGVALPAPTAATGTLESTGTAVTGTGTAFTGELRVGDVITHADFTDPLNPVLLQSRRVIVIADDTNLTLDAPFSPDLSAGAAFALGRLTEVEWHPDDVLPFDLCVAALLADGTAVPEVSVARGNVVLADHGRTVTQVDPAGDNTVGPPLTAEDGRFRPRLEQTDVTYRAAYDPAAATATALVQDVTAALPVVDLRDASGPWTLRTELLASDRFARDFVVETDNGREAVLRFGDGELGMPPAAGTEVSVTYRVGGGVTGNVGPDSLAHVVIDPALGVTSVRNPLAAQGGTAPETLSQVRRGAPGSLQILEQETPKDSFLRITRSHPEVERTAVDLTWNGSWHTLRVAVQRTEGQSVDEDFKRQLTAFLEDYRLAGWELKIDALDLVPLDIALTVFMSEDAVRGDVERRLLQTFSNRELPDGSKGFFHPDNFTFGQSVYLSQVVEEALKVPGVLNLDTDGTPPKRNRFRRFGQPAPGELETGQIRLGGLEIARVDNDPAAPENGTIRFFLEGGR